MKTRTPIILFLVAVIAAAAFIFFRAKQDYKSSVTLTIYTSNISFEYPEDWAVAGCDVTTDYFLKLPGSIESTINGKQTKASITVFAGRDCNAENKPIFTISPQTAGENGECGSPYQGERLANGLYTKYVDGANVAASFLSIAQDECYLDIPETEIMSVRFIALDAGNKSTGMLAKVDKQVFLASPQYANIKKMAESIQLP